MSDHALFPTPSRSNGPLQMPVTAAVIQLVQLPAVADEAIATRAHEKFVARGGVHGRHEEDWAEAKQELIAEARRPKR